MKHGRIRSASIIECLKKECKNSVPIGIKLRTHKETNRRFRYKVEEFKGKKMKKRNGMSETWRPNIYMG